MQMFVATMERQNRQTLYLVGSAAMVILATVFGIFMILAKQDSSEPTKSEVAASTIPPAIPPVAPGPIPAPAGPASPKTVPPAGSGEQPATKAVDLQQVAASYEQSVVWLGVEARSETAGVYRFPFCTGWIIRPDCVATTADQIDFLDGQQKRPGLRVFVYYDSMPEKVIYVKQLKVHGKYNRQDGGAETSRHYNTGIAILERSLPVSSLPVVERKDLGSKVGRGTQVIAVGYALTESIQKNPMDPASPPTRLSKIGRIAGADVASSAIDFPRRVLEIDAVEGMDGAPLFGADGKVIGTLRTMDRKVYGVLSVTVSDMVE